MQIKVIKLFMCARLNREVTQTLEFDWSDKQQAYTLDDQCGRYNNRSMDTQQHPSSAVLQDQCVPKLTNTNSIFISHTPCTIHYISISKVPFSLTRSFWTVFGCIGFLTASVTALSGVFLCRVCDEEVWRKFTVDNLRLAEREETASQALRRLSERVLQETTEDLRAQCVTVDQAFIQRCMELSQSKTQLELHLGQAIHTYTKQKPIQCMMYINDHIHCKKTNKKW